MNPLESQFRLAEIEVSKSTMDEKIIGMFRYDSDARTLGNAGGGKRGPITVIIAEIASSLYVYEQLLDAINATAEQVRHLTAAVDADPMARFEKLIQRLNEAVTTFIATEPTALSWNRVNIFVLDISEGSLCLSGVGRLTNVFLQKQSDGTYRPFDLFGSLEQPAEVNPNKPFASLICGDMHPGDILFTGTQNLERLRETLRIPERLKTLPPVTAALEIRQDLERQNIPDDFAAMVIACVQLPAAVPALTPKPIESTKEKSTASVAKMYDEEIKTQAMLSPVIAPVSREVPTSFKDAIRKHAQGAWQKAQRTTKELLSRAKPVKDPMAINSLRGMNAGHGSFMTSKRKLMLGIVGAVLLAAIGGTLWYQHSRRVAAEQTLWNAVYDQALDKKNRAEADLVYGNETRAQTFVTDAKNLLASLDQKTADRTKAKQDLQKDLDALSVKLKRETTVDHPTVLATLAMGSPANALKTLNLYKNDLYAIDSAAGAVVQIDPSASAVKKIPLTTSTTIPGIVATAAGKDLFVLLTDTRKLLSLDPTTEKVTPIPFGISKASSPQAIAIYNKRLYLLDPAANMIWKYSASGGGFGSESTYLKQNTNVLNSAKTLAIDSNVYVGFSATGGNGGKLVRYLSGVEETWDVSAVDPPLGDISSIWTTPDTDRVVVTDPTNKRIIVFRKDGKLVSQIRSGDFQNPTDVTGDAAAKKIYVVDNNRVMTLDLP